MKPKFKFFQCMDVNVASRPYVGGGEVFLVTL